MLIGVGAGGGAGGFDCVSLPGSVLCEQLPLRSAAMSIAGMTTLGRRKFAFGMESAIPFDAI